MARGARALVITPFDPLDGALRASTMSFQEMEASSSGGKTFSLLHSSSPAWESQPIVLYNVEINLGPL